MMTQTELWLVLPSVILSGLSILCDIHVIFAMVFYIQEKKFAKYSNDREIFESLLYLVVSNLCNTITWISNFIPKLFSIGEYSHAICTIIGVFQTIFRVFNILWAIVLALQLLYILCQIPKTGFEYNQLTHLHHQINVRPNPFDNNNNNNNINNNNNNNNKNKDAPYTNARYRYSKKRVVIHLLTRAFIPIIAGVVSYVPLFAGGKNNYTMFYNYDKYGAQCWLINYWQFIVYYIPLIFTLTLLLIVLLIAIIKYRQTRYFTNAFKFLLLRLMPGIIGYCILGVFPTSIRIIGYIYGYNNVALWMIVAHHVSLSSLGIANLCLWILYTKVNVKNDSKKDSHNDPNTGPNLMNSKKKERNNVQAPASGNLIDSKTNGSNLSSSGTYTHTHTATASSSNNCSKSSSTLSTHSNKRFMFPHEKVIKYGKNKYQYPKNNIDDNDGGTVSTSDGLTVDNNVKQVNVNKFARPDVVLSYYT